MADIEYDGDDEVETEESEEQSEKETPQGLRRAANKTRKVDAQNAALQRENAFLKAGIDPDDQRLRYFVKGYDGELTPAQIRQAAIEAGFIQPPAEFQQEQSAQQYNLGAQSRVMAASAGAQVEGVTEAAVLMQLEQAMNEGGIEAMLDVARSYGVPTIYEGY
jgi:hypothetical protein